MSKICSFCNSDNPTDSIYCNNCGRKISSPKNTSPKKSTGCLVWTILFILINLARFANAIEKASVASRFEQNQPGQSSSQIFISCISCEPGTPLYADIQLPLRVVAYLPPGTSCEIIDIYSGGLVYKAQYEEEYGGQFASEAYYQVTCAGKQGWVKQAHISRESP